MDSEWLLQVDVNFYRPVGTMFDIHPSGTAKTKAAGSPSAASKITAA